MNILTILTINYLESQWVLNGSDYEGLQWLDDSPKPTKAELESQWENVQRTIVTREQAKLDARESAIAKLEALGLTKEEIAAL